MPALFHLSKQLASHTQRVADTHRDTIKAALNEKTPEDRIVEVAASLGDLGRFFCARACRSERQARTMGSQVSGESGRYRVR